jgi:hypothetical protein
MIATVPHLPHELALDLVADAYATVAINALRHIDVEIRMRIIKESPISLLGAFTLESVISKVTMEFLFWKASDRIARILVGQKPE